ncbi:MAG: hypothetical protein HYX27_05940 [Acidobacteria bacterium]|nr:hypothetical protein [Acidobacteriota bacterium]
MKPYILLLLAIYYVLHQDFWNWTEARPLVFGFLPIGLAYHALYAMGAAALMVVLVKYAWPERLEHWADKEPGE